MWVQVPAPAAESVVFRFDRGNAPVPQFTLTVQRDGAAVYQVAYPPEIPKYSPYAATLAAQPRTTATMNVKLTAATTAKIFERVQSTNGFKEPCASKAKNIADTGTKTLTYVSAAGQASCTYNYSDEKTIVALTSTFQGIALTLDEGRKIEQKHRYDRLALDPETEYLAEAVKQGYAVEIAVIAPALQSLVDDPQVLERVRTRAANLLAQVGATQ